MGSYKIYCIVNNACVCHIFKDKWNRESHRKDAECPRSTDYDRHVPPEGSAVPSLLSDLLSLLHENLPGYRFYHCREVCVLFLLSLLHENLPWYRSYHCREFLLSFKRICLGIGSTIVERYLCSSLFHYFIRICLGIGSTTLERYVCYFSFQTTGYRVYILKSLCPSCCIQLNTTFALKCCSAFA